MSDPTHPVLVGILPAESTGSNWADIKVYRDHAFIVKDFSGGQGMQIFDLTQLRSVASPPATFAMTAHYGGFGDSHNLAMNEETGVLYALGSDTCAGGLHMLDVSDPAAPVFLGCHAADGYTHDAQCVIYAGPDAAHRGREICFNSNPDSGTLTIVDVTDRAAPGTLSSTGYAGSSFTHQGWLTEDHAFFLLGDETDELSFGHNTRTYVFDLRDLDAPTVVGAYTSDSPAIDHNLYVLGSHVFEANYTHGLRILRRGNLADAELAEVAFFDTFHAHDGVFTFGAWGVYPFFESGVVVVSDVAFGLFVVAPNLSAVPECDDDLDNDGDGRTDFPDDSSCETPDGASERGHLDVNIDIKPGSQSNAINPSDRGLIPVAILGSESFDVANVDRSTLAFGRGGASPVHAPRGHLEDVNGDRIPDLLSHYRTRDSGIVSGDAQACVSGETADGASFAGCDAIRTVPACGLGFELALLLPPLVWLLRRRRERAR